MDNQKTKVLAITLIIAFISIIGYAQDGIKIRVAVNTGSVLSETGSADIIVDPIAEFNSDGGVAEFKSEMVFGIEAEVMIPIGEKLGIGFEVENVKFKGNNEDPIYYNYFASSYSPIQNYEQEPLIYNTNIINLLGTFRIFPIGHGTFTPFIKLFGGMALIATDLQFQSPEDQVNKPDPLYSRGTDLSIAEPTRYSTPHFGGGVGFEYQVAGNISVYGDLSFSYINSEILNGVPNFTYNQDLGYSVYSETASITNQFSVGVSYTFGTSPGSGGGSKKGGKASTGGNTSRHRPFYKKK
ncbi:MAG: hypothetical protein HQ541_13510 [Mariniphaga sp.]|nr:hypothetical protein [Mariniphaga sp.]